MSDLDYEDPSTDPGGPCGHEDLTFWSAATGRVYPEPCTRPRGHDGPHQYDISPPAKVRELPRNTMWWFDE